MSNNIYTSVCVTLTTKKLLNNIKHSYKLASIEKTILFLIEKKKNVKL